METAVKFTKRVFVCTALVGVAKLLGPKVLVSWGFAQCTSFYVWRYEFARFHEKFAEVLSYDDRRRYIEMQKNEYHHHTVDFTKFLYHNFLKNFRENNSFSKEFTIRLISRNNFQVIQKFSKLHTVTT